MTYFALRQRVHTALGLPAPRPLPMRVEEGESETRLMMWSIRELNHLYGHVGGTVTITETETPGALTVEVEVTLPEAPGPARIFTEWTPAEELHAFELPVVRAVAA